MKILVVDDEQLVRWFLERALKRWGHSVVSASSSREAWELAKNNPFDIVLTDLRMPEENGASFIEKLSAFANRPKIIVCSAFITGEMVSEFNKDGICTLKKPFKLDELENTIKLCMP